MTLINATVTQGWSYFKLYSLKWEFNAIWKKLQDDRKTRLIKIFLVIALWKYIKTDFLIFLYKMKNKAFPCKDFCARIAFLKFSLNSRMLNNYHLKQDSKPGSLCGHIQTNKKTKRKEKRPVFPLLSSPLSLSLSHPSHIQCTV